MRIFQDLERQKQALLSRIASWPAEHRRFRAKAANWSPVEIVDHLVRVEETAMKTVLSNLPNGSRVRPYDRVRGVLVNAVMRSRIRVSVPAGVPAVVPEPSAELQRVAERWDRTRAEMARLLAQLSAEQLRRGLVKHPIAGWMTIQQGLAFLSAHIHHHVYQLDRIEKALPSDAGRMRDADAIPPAYTFGMRK